MDIPPPDDRDVKPPKPPNAVANFARFLTAGGAISLAEWRTMSSDERAAITYAGTLVARARAAMLAEEVVALSLPAEAQVADQVEDAMDRAGAAALRTGGA